jgi:hypothetical protein
MQSFRRAAGLIAALLLTLAGGFFIGGEPILGLALTIVGLIALVWQIRALLASRTDPYDLRQLYAPQYDEDTPIEEVECPHCYARVGPPYDLCPECGRRF